MKKKFCVQEYISLIFLTMVMLIPNIGILNVNMSGFFLTPYRVIVPLVFFYCLFTRRIGFYNIKYSFSYAWFIFWAVWLIYSDCQIILIPYLDFRDSFKEVISIFFAGISVYSLVRLISKDELQDVFFKVVKIIIIVSIIIGIIEIFTGCHLKGSKLNETVGTKYYLATGFQYGVNDYCAFLCFFSPIFLTDFYFNKKKLNIIFIALIYIISVINDANICVFGLLLELIAFFALKFRKSQRDIYSTFIGTLATIVIIFLINNFILYRRFESGEISSITNVIQTQINRIDSEQGSLYLRLNTYLNGIKFLFNTNFLGIGPSGFSLYRDYIFNKTGMADPHSLFIEILSQYGIGIFAIYFLLLLVSFIYSISYFRNNREKTGMIICLTTVVYAIVSFAPSSYLGYTYQWTLVAIGISVYNKRKCR